MCLCTILNGLANARHILTSGCVLYTGIIQQDISEEMTQKNGGTAHVFIESCILFYPVMSETAVRTFHTRVESWKLISLFVTLWQLNKIKLVCLSILFFSDSCCVTEIFDWPLLSLLAGMIRNIFFNKKKTNISLTINLNCRIKTKTCKYVNEPIRLLFGGSFGKAELYGFFIVKTKRCNKMNPDKLMPNKKLLIFIKLLGIFNFKNKESVTCFEQWS